MSHKRHRAKESFGEDAGILQVGRGARLRGKLSGEGVVLACGTLEGELDVGGELIVSASGRVDVLKGRAKALSVEGEVRGLFKVETALELKEGAFFGGEIETEHLQAAAGSQLEAQVRIGPEPDVTS